MNNEKDETIYNVPLWEKVMLTIDEAAAYTGVGSRKIRQLKILRESVDGSDNIVAAVNRHNEILEDVIILQNRHQVHHHLRNKTRACT